MTDNSKLDKLTEADRNELLEVLLSQRTAETPNPVLPAFDDFDGDGLPDFYGLGENDELIIVSGATLEDSLYESKGEDS